MKALTLHQPYASLVALGVKTIETRSWPAPKSLIGQHIAIHAGAKLPEVARRGAPIGHFKVFAASRCVPRFPREVHAILERCDGRISELPLGAIVATARLADCIPIVDLTKPERRARRYVGVHPQLRELMVATGQLVPFFENRIDQLPYGDFRPGRWAWLLDDVKPTTERCPACMGKGWLEDSPGAPDGSLSGCLACRRDGACPPIPAKGRQGLWTWTP